MLRLSPLAALMLTSCGPSLGVYELAGVTRVDAASLKQIEGSIELTEPDLLRVELRSATNLAAIKGVVPDNIYIFADHCPYRDGDFMMFGPYFGDRRPIAPARQEGAVTNLEVRSPPWDKARDGFFYTFYLKPYQRPRPASKPGVIEIKGYDLRSDTRDLCVRMSQAGYFLTASQSEVIMVPRAAIAKALGLPK